MHSLLQIQTETLSQLDRCELLPARALRLRRENQALAKQLATPQLSRITGTVLARRRLRDASAPAPQGGAPCPESDYARKHAVMCLRLAAECRDLAAAVATPELRARVLIMADMWEDLADQPPSESPPDDAQAGPDHD